MPEFLQDGLIAALQNYKIITNELRINLKNLGILCLISLVGIRLNVAYLNAAFMLFFKVKGVKDSLEFSKKLILQTNVGVAPGIAFGQSGEGHIRICFAAKRAL